MSGDADLERLFSRVNPNVFLQVVLEFERLAALFALELAKSLVLGLNLLF